MSLPQAIKTMLQDVVGVADADITYGTRNQGGAFPAITYTIQNVNTLSIGATPHKQAVVIIKSIDKTAESAQAIAELVEAELDTGTYNLIVFQAVINQNSVLEESSPSDGDETQPFVCVTTATIFYKE